MTADEIESKKIATGAGIALGALLPIAFMVGFYGLTPDPPVFPKPTSDVEAALIQYVSSQAIYDKVERVLLLIAGVFAFLAAAAGAIAFKHPDSRFFAAYAVTGGLTSAILIVSVSLGML